MRNYCRFIIELWLFSLLITSSHPLLAEQIQILRYQLSRTDNISVIGDLYLFVNGSSANQSVIIDQGLCNIHLNKGFPTDIHVILNQDFHRHDVNYEITPNRLITRAPDFGIGEQITNLPKNQPIVITGIIPFNLPTYFPATLKKPEGLPCWLFDPWRGSLQQGQLYARSTGQFSIYQDQDLLGEGFVSGNFITRYIAGDIIYELMSNKTVKSTDFYPTKPGIYNRFRDQGNYSFFIPKRIEPKGKPIMILSLHGSGEEARGYIENWLPEVEKQGVMVLCIQATDKNRWSYLDINRSLMLTELFAEHYGVNKRILLSGASAGGHLAYYIGLRYPHFFAGIQTFMGLAPSDAKAKGSLATDKEDRIPIMAIHGHKDQLIPLAQGRASAEFLTANGYRVKFVDIAAMAHEHYRPANLQVIKWFKEILKL